MTRRCTRGERRRLMYRTKAKQPGERQSPTGGKWWWTCWNYHAFCYHACLEFGCAALVTMMDIYHHLPTPRNGAGCGVFSKFPKSFWWTDQVAKNRIRRDSASWICIQVTLGDDGVTYCPTGYPIWFLESSKMVAQLSICWFSALHCLRLVGFATYSTASH